jgi:hypothetical protein
MELVDWRRDADRHSDSERLRRRIPCGTAVVIKILAGSRTTFQLSGLWTTIRGASKRVWLTGLVSAFLLHNMHCRHCEVMQRGTGGSSIALGNQLSLAVLPTDSGVGPSWRRQYACVVRM